MKSLFLLSFVCSLFVVENAFASRARDAVLGTGDTGAVLNGGSFLYKDGYDIFYNPSYIADYTRWAIIEKSNSSGTAGQAQGGFVTPISSFNLGVFVNRSEAPLPSSGYAAGSLERPFEIFVGGNNQIKWGLGLAYAGRNNASGSAADTTLHLGTQMNDFELFFSFKVSGSETSAAGVQTDHTGIRAGVKYHFEDWTPYAAFYTHREAVGIAATKSSHFGLGMGRDHKVSLDTRLIYSMSVWGMIVDTGAATNTSLWQIPLNFSMENDLANWITVRAGMVYYLCNRQDGNTVAANTTGRFGATFKIAKAEVDMVVGGSGGGQDSVTFDAANGLFTSASLTYRW